MDVNVINRIEEEEMVSEEIRRKFFFGKTVFEIRDWLEENELDRHMPIETASTEIAVLTPEGVLMQIRAADANALGMWGGVVSDNETPEEGAIRELQEETGISLKPGELEYVEFNRHTHCYSSGDKALFNCYRYVLQLNEVPEIETDDESNGFAFVKKVADLESVLDHQQEFVERMLSRLP